MDAHLALNIVNHSCGAKLENQLESSILSLNTGTFVPSDNLSSARQFSLILAGAVQTPRSRHAQLLLHLCNVAGSTYDPYIR